MTAPKDDLEIIKAASLRQFNCLALAATADYFCTVHSIEQIYQALEFARQHRLDVIPLGGGSNVVLASDIAGLVIHIDLKGVDSRQISSDKMEVTFAAGENWHQMVCLCLQQGWYGLENLALIPGNVGAAPIQNIGAYGVELCDMLQSVEVIEIASGKRISLTGQDCQFAYRTSIFKQAAKDKYVIVGITLELTTKPRVNIDYPALQTALREMDPTPEHVFEAVCRIRRDKLPDPEQIPNVGSFFKNPIIDRELAAKLTEDYPSLPIYPQPENRFKLPAAWLIEYCGYKGVRRGDVGVHKNQALVLVNYQGDGAAILRLADEIQLQVKRKFAVSLEIEPRVYSSPG